MRITKRIEEYIRKQIEDKAANNTTLVALKEAADKEYQQYIDHVETIKTRAKAEYTELLRNMNHPNPENFTLNISKPWNADTYFPAGSEYVKAKKAMEKRVNDTVQEVLISMEMGGDKNDLNELLEAISFD